MGGKSKKGDRVKNNARPSSSSHSAELLGNNVPIFLNFSTGKESLFGPSDDLTSSHIDPNFQIVLKKMSKKDSVTKLKALQEFTVLCNSSEGETLKSLLLIWVRLYCSLSTDVEHRVREAAHVAHAAFVGKVKKSIAPYLKQLIGPWFTSQYDNYPPAASAATVAFEQTFPGEKYQKVILFCQDEILKYIHENLIKHTPETICNPKITKQEDMEAKYERIVIASLQGYSLYLKKLSSDQIKDAEEKNKEIISSRKFWDYSKNKVTLIRNSFFNVLISLCENASFLLKPEIKRLSLAIFNDLDDLDPMILTSVWDAALNSLVFLQDCWNHVNFEKQIFPKLNAVIKRGGRNAINIFPSIPPLLSKCPSDLVQDKHSLYGNLLKNIRLMLNDATGVSNAYPSDGKIIAHTFIECLKHVLCRFNSDSSLCRALVSEQFLPALEKKLSTPNSTKNSSSTVSFFVESSLVLRYWQMKTKTEKFDYDEILRISWNSLGEMYERTASCEGPNEELSGILSNQLEFLKILRNPKKYSVKPKGRLKFADEVKEPAEKRIETVVEDVEDEDFTKELSNFAKRVAGLYLRNCVADPVSVYVPVLCQIVNIFESKMILEEFMTIRNESSLYSLFSNLFSEWLDNPAPGRGDLVDLSFSLLLHVTRDEKELMLRKFFENWSSSHLQMDVCRNLLRYREDESVKSWTSSDEFENHLLKMADIAIESDESVSRSIITTLIQEQIISGKAASALMDRASLCLKSCSKKIVEELAENLIFHVNPKGLKNRQSLERLVVILFKLSCFEDRDARFMEACDVGLRNVLTDAHPEFVRKIAESVAEIVFSENSLYSMDHVVSRINYFIELGVADSDSARMEKSVSLWKSFLREPSAVARWRNRIRHCCFFGFQSLGDWDFKFLELKRNIPEREPVNQKHLKDLLQQISDRFEWNEDGFEKVTRYLNCFDRMKSAVDGWESDPFSPETAVKFATWNIYVGSLIRLFAGKSNRPAAVEDRTEEVESAKSSEPEKLNLIHFSGELHHFTFSVGLLLSLTEYCTSTKYYHILKKLLVDLKKIAIDLFSNLNASEQLFWYKIYKKLIAEDAHWRTLKPVLQELFQRDFSDSQIEPGIDHANDFLGRKVSGASVENDTVLELWYLIRKELILHLTEEEWSKVFVYLNKFFDKSDTDFGEKDLLTLSLLSRVNLSLFKLFGENHLKSPEERLCPEACLAWNEVAKQELEKNFFNVWQKLAQKWYRKPLAPEMLIAIHSISELVVAGNPLKSYSSQDKVKLAVDYSRYITSSYAVLQITSFKLLISLVPDLVKLDTETFCDTVSNITDDSKDGLFKNSSKFEWTCRQLEKVIYHNQTTVENFLSDFVIGDSCSVEPFTDSFDYTYSYLLLWCFLLEMCGEAHSSLRFQYGLWLRDKGCTGSLLETVFKLMPQSVVHGTEVKQKCQRFFENFVPPGLADPVKSERIEEVSCFVYRMFLQRLPNVMREWWSQCENKTSVLVDKVTSLYVSPILVAGELKNVQQDREGAFDKMQVKIRPNSMEVVATYTIDEVKMDLVFTLPPNYPLGTIKIESSNVVVSDSSRRNWMFHISKYLIHQNGSIFEALVMWNNNLDSKFEGVEECYICASILHGSMFETPRVSCQICKKKFHSQCLYKWFKTSNNSSCPMCRNLF